MGSSSFSVRFSDGDRDVSELIGSLFLFEGTLVVVDDLSLCLVAFEARRLLELDTDCCIVGPPPVVAGIAVVVLDWLRVTRALVFVSVAIVCILSREFRKGGCG